MKYDFSRNLSKIIYVVLFIFALSTNLVSGTKISQLGKIVNIINNINIH